MLYHDFLHTVRDMVQNKLGDGHNLQLRSVPKNNGVMLDGLSDHSSDSPLAPTLYLNTYYEKFTEESLSLDDICREILQIFSHTAPPPGICAEDLRDFSKMSSRIMMKLINSDCNKELLCDVPHISYLDLAVVFYLFLERSSYGQLTALIHNDHISGWDIDEYGLLSLAMKNTPQHYPEKIESMSCVLYEIAQKSFKSFDAAAVREALQEETISPSLYVLSNHSGIYGAAAILYPNVLKNFADALDQDLLVIPSSIHEVLLTPLESDIDYEEMNHMVMTINQFEVTQEERLSNHVYCYRRSDNRLSFPPVSTV